MPCNSYPRRPAGPWRIVRVEADGVPGVGGLALS
jgi:hypothetical protein